MHCQAEQSLAPPGQLETARRRYKTFMIDEILSEDTCDDLGKLSLVVGPELLPPCTDKIQVRSAEIAQSAQVLEANQQVVAVSADGQQYLLATDQESLYQNVLQDSNETLPSMAPPLQLQAGFPVHNSELLTHLEPEPQAWAPEVQRSNDGAEDQPAKLQLARSPEQGMWWYPYQSPVRVPSSDSSSSAPPLQLQAGFPVHKPELLAHVEPEPQAWAPEVQRSNDGAEDQPAKPQLARSPEPGTWWNSYQSPVSVPSSDSSSSAPPLQLQAGFPVHKPELLAHVEPEPQAWAPEVQRSNDGAEDQPAKQQLTRSPEPGTWWNSYRSPVSVPSSDSSSSAPPLQRQAGFPVHKPELLAHVEPEPQAWAPEVQRSNDGAEDQPAKQQLARSPEPGTWWNSYRSPVSVPSSDSSTSDNESSSEKEEERNVKPEGLRITKPRAALLGNCELQQENCESRQNQQPVQDSTRIQFSVTSENDKGLLKSRKRKSRTDPENNLFVCPHCGNGYHRKSTLNRHVETIHNKTELYDWAPRTKSFLKKSNCGTRVKRRLKTSHSGKEPYECPECGESFQKSASFTKHRRTHADEVRFQCPACDRSYIKQRYLVKHLISAHSGAYLSECPDCGKSFLGEEDLSMHQTKIHGGGGFRQCLDCGKCYQEKLSLITHQTLQDPFQCPECERSFVCKRSLANHRRIHQNEKLRKSLNQEGSDPEESLYKCPDCGKCFKVERRFVNHQRNHMKEQQSLQFDQGEILKVEIQDPEIHTEMQCHTESACGKPLGARLSQPEAEVEEMLQRSPDCGKIFGDSQCFANHQSMHITEGTSDNADSEETVEERKLPHAHQQEGHQEGKPYQCSSCEKSYATQYYLTWHQRIHADRRPYNCTICGKTFPYRYSLALHETTHPKGKACPHKCSYCGKGFTTKTFLSRHLQRHLMEKPYQCNVCGKAFPYRYSLTHHQEIHVKGKAHKCLFCYKTFRTKHFLQRHMRIHLETRSYQCSVCGKAFATKYSFYRHQDRHLSRQLSPSSGKDQVDGSALAIDQASDTDENSNNWSGSSTLFGHHVEETPVECPKSADGSPLARCQSVHVEENPSEALDCEGVNPIPALDGDAPCNGSSTHSSLQGQQKHTCSYCEKTCRDRYSLDKHERTHTSERSYQCEECGKMFHKTKYLIRHLITHTDLRPYPCTECGKHFKSKSHLRKHENVHKRPFSCPLCGKGLTTSAILNNHLRTHREEKPLKCSECGKDYKSKIAYKKHRKGHFQEGSSKVPKEDPSNQIF